MSEGSPAGSPYESPQTTDAPPQAAGEVVSPDDRMWAMFAHLAGLLGYALLFGQIAGPLVIYVMYKEKSKFVAFHALQSLFLQVALFVIHMVLIVLGPFTCGVTWVVNVILIVASFVVIIIAAIKSYNGEMYEYTFVGPYARQQVGA